jgi:hypothetical protein
VANANTREVILNPTAVRATTPGYTNYFKVSDIANWQLAVNNGCNQTVTLNIEYVGLDGTVTNFNSATVAGTTFDIVFPINSSAASGVKPLFGATTPTGNDGIRIRYSYSVAPASGNLFIELHRLVDR